MKQKQTTSISILIKLICVLSIIAYFYFNSKVKILYSKIDTLYMVSTIFYSAVIGMVISNNINLDSKSFQYKLRQLYKKKRNILTAYFLITSFFYFIIDIEFFQNISDSIGQNLPLLTLIIIINFIIYNLTSMGIISNKVSNIEDGAAVINEIEEKKNEIMEVMENNLKLSRTALYRAVNLSCNKENDKIYLDPLEKDLKLLKEEKGKGTYYMFLSK